MSDFPGLRMKTLKGTIIPPEIRGIVYLCDFNYIDLSIVVTNEILCTTTGLALTLYAEIPNPESQIAMGESYEELCKELEILHKNMKDPVWLQELSEQL